MEEDSMITPEVQQEVEVSYRRTLIIMTGIGISILVLLGLNFFWTPMRPSSDADFGHTIKLPITIIVASLCFASIILRRYMFGEMKLQLISTASGIKGMLVHLSKTSIILAAMTEAASLMGFVFGLLTGETLFAAYLIFAGLATFIASFPRRNAWLRAVAAAEGIG
jgi:hypothetical protein